MTSQPSSPPRWVAEAVRGDGWAEAHAELVWEMVRAFEQAPPRSESIIIPPARVRDKLAQGIPLAHREELILDYSHGFNLFGLLCNRATLLEEIGESAQVIAQRAAYGELQVYSLVDEAFVQHWEHVAEVGSTLGLNVRLLVVLARLSTQPLWWAYAERLSRALKLGSWEHGYCPVCGAWAGLLEEPVGLLRCLACGSQWTCSRGHCVFCGEGGSDLFHRLALPSSRELITCRRCERYLKVRVGESLAAQALPLDDLASVVLDHLAAGQGFHRSPQGAFQLALGGDEEELEFLDDADGPL